MMIYNNYCDKSRRLTVNLERSVLDIDDFSDDMKDLGIKYFYGDNPIKQAVALFDFYDEESQRDESENRNIVWINKKEWFFDRAGVHYGIILNYSFYNKNGEEFVLFEILYSPGIIKLIRFKLDCNDTISRGIIRSFGYRFDLDDLLFRTVKFSVRNQRDDNDNIFSTIIEFYFVSDEEIDFIDKVHAMIQSKSSTQN